METRCRRFDGVHCDSFYQFGDLSCMRQFVVNVSVPVPASSIPFHFTEKFSTWKIRFYRHKINFTKRQKRKIERRQVMDLKIKEGHLQSYLLSVIRLHMHKRFSTVVENHSKSLIFTTLRERSEQLFYLNFGAKNQRWKSSQFWSENSNETCLVIFNHFAHPQTSKRCESETKKFDYDFAQYVKYQRRKIFFWL